MTGWLGTAALYNPVTYLLAALRSLISDGWEPLTLVKGVAAILGVGVVSIGLALAALKGRATRR
jgi:ABC-2 type transport system permease protein